MKSMRLAFLYLQFTFCLIVSSAFAQTNYFPRINELRMDLWTEKYDLLEKKLEGLEQVRTVDTKNGFTLNDFFEAFSLNNIEFEAKLSNWVLAKDSDLSLLARCAYYHNMGWEVRGSKFAEDTTENQFRNMGYYFNAAREDCGKVLSRGTHNEYAYTYMIKIFQALGRDDYIHHYGREGLKYHPASKVIANAYLFSRLRRWGGTLKEVEEISKNLPDALTLKFLKYGYPDYYKAKRLMLDKKYDESMSFLLQAVEHGGPDAFAYENIADNYWRYKSYDAAIEYYQMAIDIWPYNARRYYQLSRLYEAAGDKKKAYGAILRAYELQPTNKKYDARRMRLAKGG